MPPPSRHTCASLALQAALDAQLVTVEDMQGDGERCAEGKAAGSGWQGRL